MQGKKGLNEPRKPRRPRERATPETERADAGERSSNGSLVQAEILIVERSSSVASVASVVPVAVAVAVLVSRVLSRGRMEERNCAIRASMTKAHRMPRMRRMQGLPASGLEPSGIQRLRGELQLE